LSDTPLGQPSEYPDRYAPGLLFPIARSDARDALGISAPLPFSGEDIWNAWELSWLDARGKPAVATATLRIGADSPNIVESKSLKLYLNSFSQTPFASAEAVRDTIAADLGGIVGATVDVVLTRPALWSRQSIQPLPGRLIDDLDVECRGGDVDPRLLRVLSDDETSEELHSHLLRSLCPVTNQPDTGSLLLAYRGPRIDPRALLAYIVSFRQHNDFHEACVERMFLDLKSRCRCRELSVYARYNRRGGIDINPFRSTGSAGAPNLRLWSQ
jgi:7-cyano-7-deazaguanine reductase